MVEGVGVVVVRGVGSVQALKPLFLFLYKVGVGACAGGGGSGQPAVGPWWIPGWDWRRGRWSWCRGGDGGCDLSWDRDGSRSRRRSRNCDSGRTGAVVGVVGGGVVLLLMMLIVVAVVEGDGGRRLGRSLVLAVVVVVVVILGSNRSCGVLSWWWWWGRRRQRRFCRKRSCGRSNGLPVQTQVLVLLAEPVQLDL